MVYLGSTPSTSATRSTQELVMFYKWMIGSCNFSNYKCRVRLGRFIMELIALCSLDVINATKAPEEIQMPISTGGILPSVTDFRPAEISFQLSHESLDLLLC